MAREIMNSSTKIAERPSEITKRAGTADPRKVAQLVLERIENFPETYYQGYWLAERKKWCAWLGNRNKKAFLKGPSRYLSNLQGKLSASEWSDCGATGCVAGHTASVAVELGLFPPTSDCPVSLMARKALKLKTKQANWLFSGDRSLRQVTETLQKISFGQNIW